MALRDRALRTIQQSQFSPHGEQVALVVHGFGDPTSKPDIIWSLAAGPLSSSQIVCDAIIEHFRTKFPKFSTTFTVRAKKEAGYCSREWAVRFTIPPSAFVKFYTLMRNGSLLPLTYTTSTTTSHVYVITYERRELPYNEAVTK